MSKHTPTPWSVSSAICGEHDTETVSIYHYPHEAACYEVVETGCKCGDEALTEANARHIVHCVNNYEKLVDILLFCVEQLENEDPDQFCLDNIAADKGREILSKMGHGQ